MFVQQKSQTWIAVLSAVTMLGGCALGGAGRGDTVDSEPGGGSGGGGSADAGGGGGGGGSVDAGGGGGGGQVDPNDFLPLIAPPPAHASWVPVSQDPSTPGVEGTTCAPVADPKGLAQTLLCTPDGMEEPDPAHPSPLVVVLPGYTMSIDHYRTPSEWEAVGAAHGFYVLYAQVEDGIPFPSMGIPEGPRAWYFYDGKRAKSQGDAANLAALVESLLASDTCSIHPDHVYITGISAGAYMAVVMLADYPELFAGGAIVSGGPYGCTAACSNNPLTTSTYGTRDTPAPFLNDNMPPWNDPDRVTNADPARWADNGLPKPRLIAYHGQKDFANVTPNTVDLASQWTQVLGLDNTPDNASLGLPDHFIVAPSSTSPGHVFKVHADSTGEIAVATVEPFDLGHGIMVDPGTGPYQGGFDLHASKTACDPNADPDCVNDWTNTSDFYEPYYSARFFGIVRD